MGILASDEAGHITGEIYGVAGDEGVASSVWLDSTDRRFLC
jgi:hypothetical protein